MKRRAGSRIAVGRHLAPVDNRDPRRRRRAAPLAVARDQRLEQRVDRPVTARVEALAEARHQRLLRRTAPRAPGCSRPAGDSRVVFGELQRVGQDERVGARGGAGRRVAGIDRASRISASLSAELPQHVRRSSIAARATRSPRRHSVSATCCTRASSPASRKNGRRNGQSTRSPKRRRRSRIAARSSAVGTSAAVHRSRIEKRSASRSIGSMWHRCQAVSRVRRSRRRSEAEHLRPARPRLLRRGRSARDRSRGRAIFCTTMSK